MMTRTEFEVLREAGLHGITEAGFAALCAQAERALALHDAVVVLNDLGFAGATRAAQAEICAGVLGENWPGRGRRK